MTFANIPKKPKKAPGAPKRKIIPTFILGGMVNPDATVKKGRPPSYNTSFDEPCRRMRLLGLTNEKLAIFFGIDDRTLYKWTQQYPSFGQAYALGGDAADAEVIASLFQVANGYTHKATKIVVVNGVIEREEVDVSHPPNVHAAELLLSNRQGGTWKLKGAVEDNQTITVNVVRPKKKVPEQDD